MGTVACATSLAGEQLDDLLLSTGIGFALLQLFCSVISWWAGLTARSATVLLSILAISGATGQHAARRGHKGPLVWHALWQLGSYAFVFDGA
ncbi:MAG TPA: hypothetical protein VNZ56_15075 [Verrucomicrobiae bacterium]|nr:hypothetical protein [Verrucomicrobiae bacterium]